MLEDVEWGEYNIQNLFSLQTVKNMLSKGDLSDTFSFPAYSSEISKNGIIGYTNAPEFICDSSNPIFVIFGDHTRALNIANKSFSVLDNVKVLKPLAGERNALLFILSMWQRIIPNLGYARHWKVAKNCVIQLPTKNGKIDFNFMESFISDLEAQRIAELEAHLLATGLKEYTLTVEEQKALDEFSNIEWGKFKLGMLFEKINTNKLPFKADELPKQMSGKYTLPCLTSSFKNQGLNYYAPEDGATILKNVISIPSNSDVYRAYFQSNKFTVLSDAYAIRWVYDDIELLPAQYLFAVPCINKVTDLPIYSYKNKLGGWNVVKNKCIQLPVKDGEPDYGIMNTLISAIQKLAIKDVVMYVDGKYAATETTGDKQKVPNG